jgi:ATP-dependent protease HslVU (ClpYQ) peptidase subunit
MSTVAVVRKNGLIAIAADTLTKAGSSRESAQYVVNHEKIIQAGDSYIALAGPTSMKLVLKDYFSCTKNKIRFDSVENILRTWIQIHETLKTRYYMNALEDSDDSFESSQADAVIANEHGIFGVSSHRVVQEFSKFYAYGQGSEYAMGAMFAIYDDPTKTAEDIARVGITAAAEFDLSTGLPLTIKTLSCKETPLRK